MVQQTIHDALTRVGRFDDARAALVETNRWALRLLAYIAIRSASPDERVAVAIEVKLALDNKADGGPGFATDYIIREQAHPFKPNTSLFTVHLMDGTPAGFASETRERVLSAVVGARVVRSLRDETIVEAVPEDHLNLEN